MILTCNRSLFAEILLAKFRANPASLAALLDTCDVLLVEFGRLAGSLSAKGAPPRWTGLVKDGKLLGQNLMGELMMEARATLRREVQAEQEDGPQAKRIKTE